MCETCGCGEPEEDHLHDHGEKIIEVRKDVLSDNSRIAERNRGFLESRKAVCLNVVGSPGSGKTSILEATCRYFKDRFPAYVIEGDQQSDLDAARIRATGVTAVQINTGYGCHLDASMVNGALKEMDPANDSVVFIENVGNLVCPALFDLGETERVLILSVTEGDDKPLKYPYMFRSAHICLVSKTDLLGHVDCNMKKLTEAIRSVHSHMKIIPISVKTGEGMKTWYDWLEKLRGSISYR